jgi:transglutaminase-like putative cysteine protease
MTRRVAMFASVVALLYGVTWELAVQGAPAGGAATAMPRDIQLIYRAEIPAFPPGAQAARMWIPLAASRDGQTIIRRVVRAPRPSSISRDPVYDNDILYLDLTGPLETPLEVAVEYQIRLGGKWHDEAAPSIEELARQLEASGLVIVDDDVRARAAQAAAGRDGELGQARGIYEHVIRHMAYDKTAPGWGRGDTRRACLLGKGNCTDFHALFISMARARRIPARFKIGLVIPQEPAGTIPGYHCWAEFYTNDRGWIPVDASEAWKHPELAEHYFGGREPNRVLFSVGRDLQLTPPQAGGPVNIFFLPYIEVDGLPFQAVQTEFQFQELHPAPGGGVHTTREGT